MKVYLWVLGQLFGLLLASVSLAATPTPSALLKAKQDANARGYIFETSHDDIVAKAKAEGKLRVLTSQDGAVLPHLVKLMKKNYPFLDVSAEEISGGDAGMRFWLEVQAGAVKNWDVANINAENYTSEYLAHGKKFDILGMATQGVLAIDPRMVDPANRSAVSLTSTLHVITYNKKLISDEKLPKTWEDFLKPEFKGRKFTVDIRPQGMASMIPLMGEAWVLDYARKIAAQDPIWTRGASRTLAGMAAGELALDHMTYWHTCMRAAAKDLTGSLACKVIEPASVMLQNNEIVLDSAPHPYAGLLWLETSASREGQALIDKYVPLKSSMYAQGETAKILKGLKLSVCDYANSNNIAKWYKMIIAAYGFPKAELK
jgi:spermidine/putrescine-binding protein